MSRQLSEDRASLCSFTFADGRHCRMLRSRNANYCLYHLQKVGGADPTVSPISEPVAGDYVPATALSQSLSRVFCAVAEGRMDPKQAIALARIATALLKSITGSTKEFQECYKERYWRQLIYSHYKNLPKYITDDDKNEPPKPAPSNPAPLPKTAAEFVAKVGL
jgi:hypothetical protein